MGASFTLIRRAAKRKESPASKPTFRFRAPAVGLLLLLALVSTGCSTFHRDWNRAAADPIPSHSLEGRWQGNWLSEANRHHGRLRCLISKTADGKYRAQFHANYMKFLSFGYAVVMEVQEKGEDFRFQGRADLGRFAGGEYHYEGQATATNFFSTYNSKFDQGTFRMTRPQPER